MKYVKEYINEKFTEDSDPISDLGIGFNKDVAEKLMSQMCKELNEFDEYDIDMEYRVAHHNTFKAGDGYIEMDIYGEAGNLAAIYLSLTAKQTKKLANDNGVDMLPKNYNFQKGWIVIYEDFNYNTRMKCFPNPFSLRPVKKYILSKIYVNDIKDLEDKKREIQRIEKLIKRIKDI